MVELGTRLARVGAVVFAPTYSTDLTTAEGFVRAADDIVCAYQLARPPLQHSGRPDLTQPVTVVGWSPGADFVVLGGLGSVVVGLSGCYYEFEGKPVTWFADITNRGNKGAYTFAPVFHDLRDGRWQVIMEDPAGEQAVNTIIAAITAARANAAGN